MQEGQFASEPFPVSSVLNRSIFVVLDGISILALLFYLKYMKRSTQISYTQYMITHIIVALIIMHVFNMTFQILVPFQTSTSVLNIVIFIAIFRQPSLLLAQLWTVPIAYQAYKLLTDRLRFDEIRFYQRSTVAAYVTGLLPILLLIAIDLLVPPDYTKSTIFYFYFFYSIYFVGSALYTIMLFFKQRRVADRFLASDSNSPPPLRLSRLILYPIYQLILLAPFFLTTFREDLFGEDVTKWYYIAFRVSFALIGTLNVAFLMYIRDVNYTTVEIQQPRDVFSIESSSKSIYLDMSSADGIKKSQFSFGK